MSTLADVGRYRLPTPCVGNLRSINPDIRAKMIQLNIATQRTNFYVIVDHIIQ